MTSTVRNNLYESILRKHIGWFDDKENTQGSLINLLSTESKALKGVSLEGLGTMIEALFGLMFGIIASCIYDWRIALISAALAPLEIIGSAISSKVHFGLNSGYEKQSKNAIDLANESILNH